MSPSLREEIISSLSELSQPQQEQILAFIHQLRSSLPVGTPGSLLLGMQDEFSASSEATSQMLAAIDAECSTIDPDQWR